MSETGPTVNETEYFSLFFILMTIFCGIISITLIVLIIKKRNIQPLKKKSPLLMITSVIGNFLCLFNISMCFML